MRAEVRLASKTQAGHRHQVEGLGNEDAAWVTDAHPAFDAILLVADGMGGHPRPGEASAAAVHTARSILESAGADVDVGSILGQALERAQAAVRKLRTQPTGKPPGTTLSIAVVYRGSLYIVHVGDGSVFLMRDGAVRVLAGGERRRAGNRPDQFLGQPDALEPETASLQLAPGDRLLLCTDGLTRYFTEAGIPALEAVLGRASTRVSTIAAQLTAHSRPAGYDDDTTVALAEITGFREKAAPPQTRREEPHMNALPDKRPGPLAWAVPLLAGGALLAGGFLAGRATAPASESAPPTSTPLRQPATAEQLSALPPGNLILFDPLHRRVFALATRPLRAAEGVSELRGYQVGPDGRFSETGQFRLDPAKGELTLPGGGRLPVEVDHAGAALRVLRGGTLQVDSRPSGAAVSLDGQPVGATPQRITLPAGRYRLRVEGRNWARETAVEVPAGGAVSLSVGP